MLHFPRKLTAIVAAVLSGLLALTACGSPAATATPVPATPTKAAAATSVTSVAGTPTPAATVAPTSTPGPQPRQGGTLTLAQTADPPTFNVYGTTFSLLTNHTHITHNRLLRYKSLNYPESAKYGELTFAGDLAESWEISADGKTFTIHLRKGVAWHNVKPLFGREMTSTDILGSWDRMAKDPKSVFKGLYDGVVSTSAPDRYTVVMVINRPLASWLNRLADGEAAWITAPDFVAAKGSDYGVAQDSLVGTGPFVAEKAETGSRYTYVRNPDYFEKGYPFLDKIQWLIIPDAATREAAFVSGQIHSLDVPKFSDIPRIQKTAADIALVASEGLSGDAGGFTINMEKTKWQDVRVRQAMRYLMPYDRIVKDLFEGQGARDSCIPTALRKFAPSQEELAKLYASDQAKAKDLLTQAGFTTAAPFTFDFTNFTGYNQDFLDIAQMMKAEMDATGLIKVNIKPVPVAAGRPQVLEGNYEAVMSTHATSAEPDEAIGAFVAGYPTNYMRLNDPKVKEWYDKQAVEFNVDKRSAIVLEFARYCAEQVSGIVPSPKRKAFTLQRGWVKNLGRADLASDEPREKYAWIER